MVQIPTNRTPVARCESLSRFAQGAMRRYAAIFEAPPETGAQLETLAGTLEGATTALVARQQAYRDAVLALIPLRIEVKLVDLRADDIARSVKRAADDAGEAVSAAVFPSGVTPIVRPVGQSEVAQLRALEGRIAAAASWTTKDTQLARVSGIRVAYETALKNREDGMIAAAGVRALRDAAKEDFLDVYAQVAAGIKQLFPRDKKRQDSLFEKTRTSRASEQDAEDADDPTDPSDPPPA